MKKNKENQKITYTDKQSRLENFHLVRDAEYGGNINIAENQKEFKKTYEFIVNLKFNFIDELTEVRTVKPQGSEKEVKLTNIRIPKKVLSYIKKECNTEPLFFYYKDGDIFMKAVESSHVEIPAQIEDLKHRATAVFGKNSMDDLLKIENENRKILGLKPSEDE